MAKTIPHRELRNNSSKILHDVQVGETYEITNHGEVVAVISPPKSGLPTLRVRKATIKGRYSEIPRVSIDRSVQEILDELREERL